MKFSCSKSRRRGMEMGVGGQNNIESITVNVEASELYYPPFPTYLVGKPLVGSGKIQTFSSDFLTLNQKGAGTK